jgi:hypothetical protein
VVVVPIDAARPVRLARANLTGIVAPIRPDLAHFAAHAAAVHFHLNFQSRFEQQVETDDTFSRKGQAIAAHAAVSELHHETSVVLALRFLRRDPHTAHRKDRCQRQCDSDCLSDCSHAFSF